MDVNPSFLSKPPTYDECVWQDSRKLRSALERSEREIGVSSLAIPFIKSSGAAGRVVSKSLVQIHTTICKHHDSSQDSNSDYQHHHSLFFVQSYVLPALVVGSQLNIVPQAMASLPPPANVVSTKQPL